ncbi:transmembrane protein [Legionella londiniensis]|uniref:Glycerol-3-phosphate acyltransferase n=2 Tax=Legionella londiniensis TaxID=45068 RepID=A0A0W0VSV2_9GAMM|nr:transmembrane protein [Legionella londiniensis]STX93829.1 transmembrane protein [Legionella londiniensis]
MLAFLFFMLCVLLGYIVGSFCSAIVVCRIFALPDPRIEGSKNPGATNVLRLAGKKYAIIVLFADMLKGFLPVLMVNLLSGSAATVGFTAFAAVLGHMYPVFFQFKGGKGVATALGAFFGLNIILGSMVVATWLLVANFTRYSSLASIVSIIFAPFYSLFIFNHVNAFMPLMFISLFILYKHRHNITRLIDGVEPKIIFRSKEKTEELPNEPTAGEEIPKPSQPKIITEESTPPSDKK